MLTLNKQELWWNTMPGPTSLVGRVADLLLQTQNTIISDEGGVPWEADFRISVKEIVQQRNPNILLDAYTPPFQCDPGRWIISQVTGGDFFCLPSEDPLRKAAAQNLLRDRILWVSGIQPGSQANKWIDLAVRMSQLPREQRGCMVVLTPGSIPSNVSSVKKLDVNDFIGEYDLHFFSEMLASQQGLSHPNKKYLAELAVALADGDPKKCAHYVAMGKKVIADPDSQTPDMNRDERLHAIWLAQMRVVFARIEEAKFNILQRNRSSVSVLIGHVDEFGNCITEVGDIELRHLVFAEKQGWLHLPAADSETIQALHTYRNELAHHHILSFQELEMLNQLLVALENDTAS